MKDLSAKLKELPAGSGVYLMLDAYGQILYVGKAKSLKNRVRQYFQNSTSKTEKTMLLVEKIEDFQYILTRTELEALVLENNLIKEHKPYYNILLKDDKSYPYIRINKKQRFPRPEITRRLKDDGSRYFGPYMLGISTKMILDLLHAVFPLRSCQGDIKPGGKKRACLNYHIERCSAPCMGKVTEEEYERTLNDVIDFLNGNDKEVKRILIEKMEAAAAREEFETAMEYRDNLAILEKLIRKQVMHLAKDVSLDIFSYATNGMYGVINYMVVRGGKVLGAENHPVNEAGAAGDILSTFLMQFYEKNPLLADEIIVSEVLTFQDELQEYLAAGRKKKVKIIVPQLGIKHDLVQTAYANAKDNLEKTVSKIASKEALTRISVERLQESLGLRVPPKRMECYDISNISGTDKVASMVVFINGEPAKSMYRRFRIKTVKGIDDFASMKEVISRRIAELSADDPSFSDYPNLIVVDGGKGQLSSAYEIIEPTGIEIIGLAKREEEIFLPGQSEPIILAKDSLPLTLLQRLRDEAHRFAITYHRALRKERQTRSNLMNIEGVGKARARALLTYFKKVEKIAEASLKEIMEVPGFGETHAKAVRKHFGHKDEDTNEI